jgi:ABC-type nitrate/sulfonate/bicarbonate transport system substrate-binding protein
MMLTSTAFAENSPDKVVAILEATRRAIELMRVDPQRAAEIIGRVTGVPPPRELKVIQTLKWGLRLDHSVRSSLEQTAAFLKDTGKLARLPDLQKAFDDGFLKQVQMLPSEKKKKTWE